MNAVMNRKLLVLLGPVAVLVMFAGTVKMASLLMSREYKEPYGARSATVDPTPRATGLADEAAAADKQARAKPYVEAEYRTFPIVGSRVAIGRSRSSTCCLRRSSWPSQSSR